MTGYESKKKAASAKTIDQVNWADHEPDGLVHTAQKPVAWLEPEWGEKICPEVGYEVTMTDDHPRDLGWIPLVAQPAQEPVAWVLEWTYNGEEVGRRIYDDETHCKFDAGTDGGVCRPLVYGDTTPPAAQRQWVGLTQDELLHIGVATGLERAAAYMIEAKLKDKNI